jgi:hypothetical protein
VTEGGSATVAVPPFTGVPDELPDGLLDDEQAAAVRATAAVTATAARRSLRLQNFICAPSVRAAPKGLPARRYARSRLAAAWRALGAQRFVTLEWGAGQV